MSSRLAELGAFLFGVSIISRLGTDTAEGAQALKGAPPPQHCAHAGADAGGGHGASTGHCVLSSPTSMLRPEGAEHRYLSTNPYLPTNRWPDARKGHREEGSHRTQPAPRKKASGNAREAMRDESTRGRIP